MYVSKRDLWIVAMIWLGALVSAYAGIAQLSTAGPLAARLAALIALLAAAGFMLWVLYGTHYTLTDAHLLIRCGPFRYRVPLSELDLVQPSRNPLSSPACSLDRLLLKWRGARKRILISPERKTDFVRDVQRRCPQLKRDGDRLIRAA